MKSIGMFILHHAVKAPAALWVLFLCLAVLGLVAAFRLPIDAVPDITNVQVMINTKTDALSPDAVETSVTLPVESAVLGLPGVEEVRSLSRYGLSQVVVICEDGTDLYFIRQLISEKLQALRSTLPAGVSPNLGPVSTGLGEVLMYAVLARDGSPLARRPETERLQVLRAVQDRVLRPQLKAVPGVAEIDSTGGHERIILIEADPARLEYFALSLERLGDRLTTLGIPRSGGFVDAKGKRIIIRSPGPAGNVEEIRRIRFAGSLLDESITLSQVATVRESGMPRVGAASLEGKESVLGTVLMRIGENSRKVAEDAERKLGGVELPADVEVRLLYSRSYLVNTTIRTVITNLTEGALLVVLVLFLVLRHFRAAIIVALVIPLSMLMATTGMWASKISANLMSLGAVDFGLLVDAAVVITENTIRKLALAGPKSWEEKKEVVTESVREVAGPVLTGMIIIMAVYLPVLTLGGIEGKMFRPMAYTVLFALGASLIVTFVLLPSLLLRFVRTGVHSGPGRRGFVERYYAPLVKTVTGKHAPRVVLPAALLLVGCLFLFPRLGAEFIPELDEGDLVIGVVWEPDISLDASIRQQAEVEKIIRAVPEVQTVFSRIGTPSSDTDPMPISFADTFVILKKEEPSWIPFRRGRPAKAEILSKIAEAVAKQFPDAELSPTQPIAMRFNEMLEGSRADVALMMYDQDLSRLYTLTNEAVEVLEKVEGVEEVGLNELTALKRTPLLNVKINMDALAAANLDLEVFQRTFENAMAGRQVGQYPDGDYRYPVVLRLREDERAGPAGIGRIPIELPGGNIAPLSRFVQFQMQEQITTISRRNGMRYSGINVFLKTRDVEGVVRRADQALRDKLDLKGVRLEWGGQFAHIQSARQRLLITTTTAVAAIIVLLLLATRSVGHSLLILSGIPFALTGGILALYFRGIPFSVSAGIGFIALMGIALLNSVVLLHFLQELRRRGVPVKEAILQAATIRFRPIVTTALVASLGFVPMALSTGLGAEVQRPLATVVIGGLVSSTILTLVVLPALYAWIMRARS